MQYLRTLSGLILPFCTVQLNCIFNLISLSPPAASPAERTGTDNDGNVGCMYVAIVASYAPQERISRCQPAMKRSTESSGTF